MTDFIYLRNTIDSLTKTAVVTDLIAASSLSAPPEVTHTFDSCGTLVALQVLIFQRLLTPFIKIFNLISA
jgi:hypothetical protein